jgi:hypothetical protein
MEVLLIIGVVVAAIVVMLFLTRHPAEDDAHTTSIKADRMDADRQFRRPPNEGDLL